MMQNIFNTVEIIVDPNMSISEIQKLPFFQELVLENLLDKQLHVLYQKTSHVSTKQISLPPNVSKDKQKALCSVKKERLSLPKLIMVIQVVMNKSYFEDKPLKNPSTEPHLKINSKNFQGIKNKFKSETTELMKELKPFIGVSLWIT